MKPTPILVATDVVVLAENSEKILLIQRKYEPFKSSWALPGGFVEPDEDLAESAVRELNEEVGILVKPELLKHTGTYGHPSRDPRGRVISVVFMVKLNELAHKPQAADDAKQVAWFSLNNLPALAFDHTLIIADAIKWI